MQNGSLVFPYSDSEIEKDLRDRFYFEIPSSFDLKKFGTEYDEQKTTQNTNPSRIVCRYKEDFQAPRLEKVKVPQAPGAKKAEDRYCYIIDKDTFDAYIKAIIADVKAVQDEETDPSKKRPVLIFADPTLTFRYDPNDANGQDLKLWDELKKALQDNHLDINPLTDKFAIEADPTEEQIKEKSNEISDSDLQNYRCCWKSYNIAY